MTAHRTDLVGVVIVRRPSECSESEQSLGRPERFEVASNPALTDDEIAYAWRHRSDLLLSLVCSDCGGGRRARLGVVHESPRGDLLGVEFVVPPHGPERPDSLAAHATPGWGRRGDPDAAQEVYALDDAWSAEHTFATFCPRLGHGWRRPVAVGDLRDALCAARKRRVLAV